MNSRITNVGAQAPTTDTTLRGRRTIEVCVVCGHEHIHGHKRDVRCPECANGASCSSFLVRGPTGADR